MKTKSATNANSTPRAGEQRLRPNLKTGLRVGQTEVQPGDFPWQVSVRR